jgi:predicted glycosyltransferase
MRCGRVLLLLVALLGAAHGVKILGLFAVSGKSHTHFFAALTTELSRRGHNVTVVTGFPTSYRSENYREIFVDTMAVMQASLFNPFEHTEMNILRKLTHTLEVFSKLCPVALKDKQV